MIQFDPTTHVYSNAGVKYISATTLIKRYSHPFDAEFMATYKALKDVILENLGDNHWSNYKKRAGGWDKTPIYFRENADPSHPLTLKTLERKEWYIQYWKKIGEDAAANGTRVHEEREQEIKQKDTIISSIHGEKIILAVSQDRVLPLQDFFSDKVYTEIIVSNDHYCLAGQVDRTDKRNNIVHLSDYKTYKEVKHEGFANKMMKFPLEELPDCNMSHATLQLSLYGWMFEQLGYKVGSLKMLHLYGADYKQEQAYVLPYRKELVQAMITHYRTTQ